VNKFLIDDQPLIVLPALAKLIGLNESIVLQQIHFWLNRSEKTEDGFTWVYKTYEQWQSDFPFWSVDTIKRVIRGLEKAGYLHSTSKYNRLKIDRTKWYRIDYSKFETVEPDRRAKTHDREGNLHRPTGQIAPLSAGQLAPSNNHRPPENTYTEEEGEKTPGGVPPAPLNVEQVINLYHEVLTMCPRLRVLTDKRKRLIAGRIAQDLKTLAEWRNYFEFVAQSDWLTGGKPGTSGRPPFVADLEWLCNRENFAKVAEEKYHREGDVSHGR
jgi:hypothetical protein